MRIFSGYRAQAQVARLGERVIKLGSVEKRVQRIIDDVRRGGDCALRNYAQRWDRLPPDMPIRVAAEEIESAWKSSTKELQTALRKAAARIRQFSEWQKPVEWMRSQKGISLGQLVRPLDAVGCYVPGGRYPLVSTLLMTVIPAQVAGVKNIRVVSPQPRPEVLAAARLLGLDEFHRVGGAHAIAALAYGTETVARVDKIVGPGNFYVTAAKKLVSFDCAIDFLAGPTEVAILSESGTPEFIAADLVAQAEHDPEALAIFITSRSDLAMKVAEKVRNAARENGIARQSLGGKGAILLATSRKQALEWANRIAPEHITVEEQDLPFIRNAGSVFVGDYSPQAAGDYASGPNHVLPTCGAARFRGGLSVLDFVKLVTVQKLSRPGLRQIASLVISLATTEGLKAHADSISRRSSRA